MSLAERLSQAYVFIKDRVNEIQLGYKSMTIILSLVNSKRFLENWQLQEYTDGGSS